jgi:beta-galactosidase
MFVQVRSFRAALRFWRMGSVLLGCLVTAGSAAQADRPAEYVWLESEAPTARNTTIAPSDWGGKVMSGDKWLQVSVEEKDVEKQTPPGGFLFGYDFTAPSAGHYEVWNRIGFETVRSPFDWRLDNGDWKTITPDDITTDLTEIGFWASTAWMRMGEADLSSGKHTLQIRLPISYDANKKPQRLLYASDALCLFKGAFHPHGRFRPDDSSWQTDADRAAAAQVFQMPEVKDAAQTALSLKGSWQIARYDETLVEDRTGPIRSLPDPNDLFWQSMIVPGDRNKQHPELTFAHRYFLRTQVQIPADEIGHAFTLHFPSLNMLGTVFVNGQSCGFDATPLAAWDCDITRAVKPGINAIWVGIKDTYYALTSEDSKNLRYSFMLPTDFFNDNQGVGFRLDFPVWNHRENGILQEPTLVVAGKAYTSDVFVMPSVKNKTLGLEVTVKNSTDQAMTVTVDNAVVPLAGGAAEKTFAPQQLQVPAGQEATLRLAEAWANPRLWWPDDPQQYLVVTRLSTNGQVIDERQTKFGCREWDWHGPTFTLNGIPWHGRADLVDFSTDDPEAALKTWQRHGQNMERFWSEDGWGGMDLEHTLDFFDAHGVLIRRTGIFDGEMARYGLVEQVNQSGQEVRVARRALFDNWRRQLVAWAKGQRNHPSIFVWSMENEITFINSRVFGNNAITDPEMRKAAEMLAALDPTRPQMTDGGNALLDESLPIYGGHYMEPPLNSLPTGAYDRAALTHRQQWPITQTKPILLGEAYYATGIELADLATIGGESAFVGKAEAYPAMGLIGKMLSEGYRWSGLSFHFWLGGESDQYYNAWQPIAVLCRQWDGTFGSGQKVKRTLGIFNDTRYDDPITLTWTLTIGGKQVARETTVHHVAPGMDEKFDVTLPMPTVTARQEGRWNLTLAVKGKTVFQDVKLISVLNAPTPSPSPKNRGGERQGTLASLPPKLGGLGGRGEGQGVRVGSLTVYDPHGSVLAFLKSRNVPFTVLDSLTNLPPAAKVLLIGNDALDPTASGSSRLAAYAAPGRAVLVLEQRNPLKYQALPGEMQPDTNQGEIGFGEDLDHPALKGLEQKDFFTWGPDGLLYRDAYNKPTSSGKSLVECGDQLKDSALVEMPAGKGVLLLSQLVIGEKLAVNAVAQRLLMNLLNYGLAYKQTLRPVILDAGGNTPLAHAMVAIGVAYSQADDPLQAIRRPGSIAVLNATPANLKALADAPAQVRAFTQGGGWILFNNLTPDGLTDFDKIVGVEHIIRPFGREKVTFPPTRSPLTAGLAASNIVMGSGQQIFSWAAGQYPATDAFSYVVDYEDVAPFGKSPFFGYGNITNNFVSADGWPLIEDFPAPTDGKPYAIPITLPRPETIREFTWIGNTFYDPTTKVNLIFDGKEKVALDVQPNNEPQTFVLSPPRTAKEITLEMADWKRLPDKQQDGKDLIGLDNIYLKAQRSPEFYQKVKPMLNIGVMVAYPRGSGGLILCNVLFKDTETVPENSVKKRTILATLLHNLDAPFAGGSRPIAGANLQYFPLDLSKQVNQYRDERGWFGDKSFTFAALPTGKQRFAGVLYDIYNFTTSPVPTAVMLGGDGIPGHLPDAVRGIPVNRKADALFFLQTARMDQRRNAREVRTNKQFEMADYVVTYADGQQVNVPIYAEINVDDYRQKTPTPLPGAQVAWVRPYPGTDVSAVAYQMQWNNPRPNVAIKSLDLIYGPDRRGVPALLAVTAARQEEVRAGSASGQALQRF